MRIFVTSFRHFFSSPVTVGCAPRRGAHRADVLAVRKRTLRVLLEDFFTAAERVLKEQGVAFEIVDEKEG